MCVRLLSISSTSDDDLISSSDFKKKRNRSVSSFSVEVFVDGLASENETCVPRKDWWDGVREHY